MIKISCSREKKTIKFGNSEAVAQRCSVKKVLSEILQNSQENTCARASFLIKLQAKKEPSCTCVLLWILQIFQEHLFLQNTSVSCFWELPSFGKFVTEMLIFRSSRSQMFFKIGVPKNFAIFTGKHLFWPLQAFFYRTPAVAASRLPWQQILFFS